MENLKLIREKNNISQKKLSEILHCSQTLISKWEKGLREPSFDIVKKTASLFHCSTDYLLGFESNEQKEPETIELEKEEKLRDEQKWCIETIKTLPIEEVDNIYCFMLGLTKHGLESLKKD